MPVGIPWYYEPCNDELFRKTLCTDRKDFSFEALDYLSYMSDDPRFQRPDGSFYLIRCVINGEKTVETSKGKFKVDGYVETHEGIYLIEYQGCRWHSCPNCLTPTISDTTARDQRKMQALKEVGKVIIMWGCQWKQIKRRLRVRESPFSAFYFDRYIPWQNIVAAIQRNVFFGIANVDISAPESVREKYRQINFPPLFKRAEHKIESLSPEMAAFYEAYGTKPTPQLTVGFEAEGMSLSSDYLKFLLDIGFLVKKLHWALEYQKGKLKVPKIINY